MNWLSQKTGIINCYRPEHKGTQPIRVLNYFNVRMFEGANPSFPSKLEQAIKEGKISKTINIVYGEYPIKKAAYINCDNRQIYLDETFLSYLWCICHSVFTIYSQEVDLPRYNSAVGYEKYPVDNDITNKAYELFDYAKSLIKVYSKWDIETMPNPEQYLAEKRNYIEQPNMFYTEAIKFILCHEFIHAIKHIDKRPEETDFSSFIKYEKEADYEAIEIVKKGISHQYSNKLAIQTGIPLGILSIFYLKSSTANPKHPDNTERLVTALEQLQLDDNSDTWGIILVGLKLWSDQFQLGLNIPKIKDNKKAFYQLIQEIKNKQM